jgi:hypothetical protein
MKKAFEVGNQVLISSHRKLLWPESTVVNVDEKRARGEILRAFLAIRLPSSIAVDGGFQPLDPVDQESSLEPSNSVRRRAYAQMRCAIFPKNRTTIFVNNRRDLGLEAAVVVAPLF